MRIRKDWVGTEEKKKPQPIDFFFVIKSVNKCDFFFYLNK